MSMFGLPEMPGSSTEILSGEGAQKAVFAVILKHGNQTPNQAWMHSGCTVEQTNTAIRALVEKGRIRPRPGTENKHPDHVSYEPVLRPLLPSSGALGRCARRLFRTSR